MSELELWLTSKIDKEWLEWYGDSWRIYEEYLKQKEILIKKIGALKSIDYSKDKVINGNSQHLSEQERYTMRLERINKAIQECEATVIPAKERLKNIIKKIHRAEYRKILILRYIERWKWSDIIEECFWYEQDFDKKDVSKFKDKILAWNRQAINLLEKLSDSNYVPAQLTILSGGEDAK